jgi:hypothetical protein
LEQLPALAYFDDVDDKMTHLSRTDPDPEVKEELEHRGRMVIFRRFTVTKERRLGLAHEPKLHNILCIFHGCRSSIILKPHQDRKYSIGEVCFLEHAMNGEAVTWNEDEADDFIIV